MSLRRVALGALVALSVAACTSTLQRGEALYQQGDRRAALEVWRSITPDSHDHAEARRRMAQVEEEHSRLVRRYRQRARYFERKGRLAEAILSHRVVLELEPEDGETLLRVQELSRELMRRKEEAGAAWRQALEAGRLKPARTAVTELRRLDPYDPAAERGEREVEQAFQAEIERLLASGRRGFTAGDYTRATERFGAVLALDPENESAQGYLSYMETIREEEARQAVEAARAEPPTPPRARPEPRALRASEAEIRAEGFHRNALAAEREGDPWGAIRQELRALEADPDHAAARAHLGELRGRMASQVPELIEAGRVAFQQEDLQSALDQWRRALLVEPGNAKAAEYASRAERLLQNLEQLRAEPEPPGAVGIRE